MADNKEELVCPACGKTMEKIFMPEQGVNLDVCTNCGGIYFDNRELDKFDEDYEDITPLTELFANKTFEKVDSEAERKCPVCGMKMVKNYASIKHEIQVDECYSCGGKFLDNGELEKIRAQYSTEEARVSDVISELYKYAGDEIKEQQKRFDRLQTKQTIFSKLVKMRKNY